MKELLVAPNLINSLGPWRRLPLLENDTQALTFKGIGMFTVYVPSKYGGVLEVGCDQSTAKVVIRHPKPTSPPLKDLAGNEIPMGQKFTYSVRRNEFKWFYIFVGNTTGDYKVWATFKEIGLAREAKNEDADPLIPWNFWYFPYARSGKDESAWGSATLKPCQKYEQAFTKTGVLRWEKRHHNDPSGTRDDWEGHCDNGALASEIFNTPPAAGLDHNGVHFNCEELKFFATVFSGRFGRDRCVWGLPGRGPMLRQGPFQYYKPSQRRKLFGKQVGGFHLQLVKMLLKDMSPVLMDLRDDEGTDHKSVWNQAVYKYVAQFWETTPHGDWLDIQVRTQLMANEDDLPDDYSGSSGLPANIEANGPRPGGKPKDAVPDPAALKCNEILLYRLIFRGNGTIAVRNKKNEWWSATREGETTELHAPRFMFKPRKVSAHVKSDAEVNPRLNRSDILVLLKLRDRYK